MRTILVGTCKKENLFQVSDPDEPSEVEFESAVVQALSCIFSTYTCVVFGGRFLYDGIISKPDLALVAKDCSHWFIIEVELVSHSFEGHVLPQIKSFCYGDPQSDCAGIFARELRIPVENAKTLVNYVPRSVVVVANKRDQYWEIALAAHRVQYLAISRFKSQFGCDAFEVDGTLWVLKQSLGFGQYTATDRSLRFPKGTDLPLGMIQIDDPLASIASWIVNRDERCTWITKEKGTPDLADGSHVQLVRTIDGKISMIRPQLRSSASR